MIEDFKHPTFGSGRLNVTIDEKTSTIVGEYFNNDDDQVNYCIKSGECVYFHSLSEEIYIIDGTIITCNAGRVSIDGQDTKIDMYTCIIKEHASNDIEKTYLETCAPVKAEDSGKILRIISTCCHLKNAIFLSEYGVIEYNYMNENLVVPVTVAKKWKFSPSINVTTEKSDIPYDRVVCPRTPTSMKKPGNS